MVYGVRLWATLCLAGALCTSAVAQVIPRGDEPGRIDQRFKTEVKPKAKATVRAGLESTLPPEQADQIKLVVRKVRFEGNTVFSDDELSEATSSLIGKQVSLLDVFGAAAGITAKYGGAGYTLSRAVVPPQELDPAGATVTIQIVEGYIDEVVWPDGLERYRDLFTGYAAKIVAERPVRVQTIERYLLLANDLPGLTFSSSLQASETNPAASTLVVTLTEEDHYGLLLGLDNRGTEGSGPIQPSAVATLSNVIGLHEEIEFGYVTGGSGDSAVDPELHYLTFSYTQVLNSEGLTLDLSGNASWGQPETAELLALEYETDSVNFTTALLYPFIRTRPTNLVGTFAFDFENSRSYSLDEIATEDRMRSLRVQLAFDHADELNGVSQVILSVSQGFEGLGSTDGDNIYASRLDGRVDFTKATLLLSRLQDLQNGNSAYILGYGQLSPHPLLSSQECGYGGGWIGRAFEPSVITGDRCALVLGELRHDFDPGNSGLSALQGYAFADYGSVWNIDPPLGTPEQDDAASLGAGLRLGWKMFEADLQIAYQLDQPEFISTGERVGVFFDIAAEF